MSWRYWVFLWYSLNGGLHQKPGLSPFDNGVQVRMVEKGKNRGEQHFKCFRSTAPS